MSQRRVVGLLRKSAGALPVRAGPFLGVPARVPRVGAVLAAGVGAAVAGALMLGPVAGLCAGFASAIAMIVIAAAASARAAVRDEAALLEAIGALAAELRAGRPPPQALDAAATIAGGRVGRRLRDTAAIAALGGDIGAALADTDRRGPPEGEGDAWPASVGGRNRTRAGDDRVADGLRGLAAGWEVSSRSGASLGDVLDRVESDLRAAHRHRLRIGAELAGPRATAGLLAVLPALGLGLGAAMGGHPVHVLTHTTVGEIALVAGTALDGAGVWWTARIVHSAAERS